MRCRAIAEDRHVALQEATGGADAAAAALGALLEEEAKVRGPVELLPLVSCQCKSVAACLSFLSAGTEVVAAASTSVAAGLRRD